MPDLNGAAELDADLRPRKRQIDVLASTALFIGGLLAGIGILLTAQVAARPAASLPPVSLAPAAERAIEPLVTLPPIVAPTSATPVDLADGYALGDTTAKVTVEVWADYQCPYCRLFTLNIEPQIVSTYVGQHRVRLVFRDLPFLGDESRWAAVAARLAEEQGKFWPYHDYLFANQHRENDGSFNPTRLGAIAAAVGLDMTKFDAGMTLETARTTYSGLESDSMAAANALGIDSTPTVVVAGTKLEKVDWATIKAAIDRALAAAGS